MTTKNEALKKAAENAPRNKQDKNAVGLRKKGIKPTAPAVKNGKLPGRKPNKAGMDVIAEHVHPASKSPKKDVSASSAAALNAKSNADKTAQPGIIASVMNILTAAKKAKTMLTVEEIVQQLAVLFPDRPTEGMTTTVRAQLSRLPYEKEFQIQSQRDGRRVRYMAA